MPPAVRPAKIRPRLSLEQREDIAILFEGGACAAEIARVVGCHRSTIGRELKTNRAQVGGRFGTKYRASTAQQGADQRARRAGGSKLARNARLRAEVQDRLEEEHSPQQISARLKIDFPDDKEMQLSHEPIYLALYVQGRGELRRDLHQRLRTGRAARKTRRAVGERRGRIVGMVNISERPAEADDRAVPGQ